MTSTDTLIKGYIEPKSPVYLHTRSWQGRLKTSYPNHYKNAGLILCNIHRSYVCSGHSWWRLSWIEASRELQFDCCKYSFIIMFLGFRDGHTRNGTTFLDLNCVYLFLKIFVYFSTCFSSFPSIFFNNGKCSMAFSQSTFNQMNRRYKNCAFFCSFW